MARPEGFRIKSKMILQEVIRPNGPALRATGARIYEEMVREVTEEIARIIAAEVLERIPRGHGSKLNASYVGLKTLWAQWAVQPHMEDGGAFIGSVAQMDEVTRGANNMTSKKGQWRYGAWFNLEWGREWPHVGNSYVYQENPGPNTSPSMSAPPGAGPADIAMSKWLKVTEHRTGELAYSTTRKLGPENRNRARSHARLVANWHYRSARTVHGGHAKRLTGLFGQAPIRMGYLAGLQIAEQRLPELMRQALMDAARRK